MGSSRKVIVVCALVTALVTVLSYTVPEQYAATAVGLAFLAATYWLVLRGDEALVRSHGLALGGLLESKALSPQRLLGDFARAGAWALGFALVLFPPFWLGFVHWWHPAHPFVWRAPGSLTDEVLGQLLVIALPEEAFYRGYVQTELGRVFSRKVRIAGAEVGWELPVTCAVFAAGHFLTQPHPQRLAVFFPALIFGWLRARTGGIGAALLLHALSNLFSSTLGRGYGLFGGP